MSCELETIQDNLCSSGIGKLNSPIQLRQTIAQLLCNLVSYPPHSAILTGDGVTDYFITAVVTTSGFFAVEDGDGNITTYASGEAGDFPAANDQLTIWSCTSLADSSPAGDVVQLEVQESGLTALDISDLTSLQVLNCSTNQITVLDLSGLPELTDISCGTNQIASLNIASALGLQNLSCGSNLLTSLNVSGLSVLEYLDCGNNQLTVLNVTGLSSLLFLFLSTNNLNSAQVDATLVQMDGNGLSNGQMEINDNAVPGAVGLAAKAALILRGWTVTTD